MIKVFENFDFSRVGQMQSLLESHGIRTFLKNQYGSSVMGEVPFVEVVDLPVEEPDEDWICAECGVDVEGTFDRCWKCGTGRD